MTPKSPEPNPPASSSVVPPDVVQGLAGTSPQRQIDIISATLDHIAEGVVVTNKSGRFVLFNPAAKRILGIGALETTPDKWTADYGLFLPDRKTPFPPDQLPLYQAMGGKTKHDVEIYIRHAEAPQGRWLSVSASPLRDESGEVEGGIAVFRDISEHKEAARELLEAKEAAERANASKGRFLATMSHDIRTPLTAIIGMTQLVLDSKLTSEQREHLSIVKESSQSMLLLIEDLLDLSRIDVGRLALKPVSFNLRESLGDTMKSLAFRAHGKGLELALRVAPEVPDHVVGDPGRLRQIVVNLVGNAVKFTSVGEVVVTARVKEASLSSVLLEFLVRDTGIGIRESDRSTIFEAYEQADPSVERQFGGTGLGLAISSKLVELMGGQISVKSEVGRGSEFHFTIRCAREASAPTTGQETQLRGRRVLVVDDNPTCRTILSELMQSWGMEVETRSGGREALSRMGEERDLPDLIVIDATMPGMDGFALAAELTRSHSSVPVAMMLSSSYRLGDVARCEEMGIKAYLQKPAKQSELLDTLKLALDHKAKRKLPTTGAPQRYPLAAHPLRILLAEDSLVNQKLAAAIMEKWGHTLYLATNGREAVAHVKARPLDLILMDLEMPEMNGLEAVRIIREMEKEGKTRIPIIAMTAHAGQEDRDRCLEAGMDGFVSKPFNVDELFEAIEHIRDRPEGAPSEGAFEVEGLDWDAARKTLRNDDALLREIAEAFLEDCPLLLTSVREAVTGKDAEALRRAAHKLKGSMRYFGETMAYRHALDLETTGQEESLPRAPSLLVELEEEVERLQAAVAAYLKKPSG